MMRSCGRVETIARLDSPRQGEVITVKAYKKPTITGVDRKAVMRGDA